MLAKLMQRKKSYERMMRNGQEDGMKSPIMPDVRPNGLSRALANSSTRK